jgi:hypothetical protein
MEPWDRGFRKIATTGELRLGEPMLFRSGGQILVILRSTSGVVAADATSCVDAALGETKKERLEKIAQCLGPATGGEVNWDSILEIRSLPVEVRSDDVWVCVDQCSSEA